MKKVCNFCGNKNFQEKLVQYIYRHVEKMFIVDNVPCEQCEFCGEQYFKSEVLKKIENDFKLIHFSGKRPQKEISVPVEDFIELV